MQLKETINEFHERHGKDYSNSGQFNVYRVEDFQELINLPHYRRDFYKITLTTKAEGVLCYADKVINVRGYSLVFSNPMIPYSWERLSGAETGFLCLFTEDFVNNHLKAESLADSSLFKAGGNPVLFPDQKSVTFLSGIFDQMLSEMQSNYINKYELMRSYVQIIIHEALKMETPAHHYEVGTSSSRLSNLFLELLERQFPIASPQQVVKLKNASEFASQLSVHTNHLNRVLKELTGKTTSDLIAERFTKEAKALLMHSNWDIAEVGYSLGFEHASNFNIFFKKQTSQTPNHFRRQKVAML